MPKYDKFIWTQKFENFGSGVTSVLFKNNHLFMGFNGYVFRIDPVDGSILEQNSLEGTDNHEVNMSISKEGLLVATNGQLFCLNEFNLKVKWHQKFSGMGTGVTTLCYDEIRNYVFVGFAGKVFEVDCKDGTIKSQNHLKGYGEHLIHMDILVEDISRKLIVGMDGRAFIFPSCKLDNFYLLEFKGEGGGTTNVLADNVLKCFFIAFNGRVFSVKHYSDGRLDIKKNGLPHRGAEEVRLGLS